MIGIERIEEICNNLNIESIEIRTEDDEDVKPYMQERDIKWIEIELPPEIDNLKSLITKAYMSSLEGLRSFGLTKPIKIVNKKDLLLLRKYLEDQLKGGNKASYYGLSLVAQSMKLDHAVDLIGTQGLIPLDEYWRKLEKESTRASKTIIKNDDIKKAINITTDLIKQQFIHPKLKTLVTIITKELGKNPRSKIIVFANYRNTVKSIVDFLNKNEKIKSIELMGQKEGVTQKIQLNNIKRFESGEFNVLVGTSIGEEGLDISGATLAIFYDIVSSEIRTIQRIGRVGRVKAGEIILLITKGSRDEAFYWTAKRKEKSMKKTVKLIQDTNILQTKLETNQK